MTKQEIINKLVKPCLEIAEREKAVMQRTKDMQRMASLARQGKKDTKEFYDLEIKNRFPSVIDFGDPVREISKIMKRLEKYSLAEFLN